MSTIEKISIALPEEMAASVRDAVSTGQYASSSEVIRDALREWKSKRALRAQAIEEIGRLWDQGVASGCARSTVLKWLRAPSRALA